MSKKGEQTKRQICLEAYKLFAEKGFKEITMQDICEKTGLSRGGLYRHYNSTEQIFLQIINYLMQIQENEVLKKIEQKISAKQILLEILQRYEQEMLDNKNSLSIAIYEFFSRKQYSADQNKLYEQYLYSKKTWEALITYGIKTKEFKNVNSSVVFDVIVFSYQGVRMYSQLIPIHQEIPQHITEVIKQILLKDYTQLQNTIV